MVKLLDGDAVCWFAYPKGTSKRLSSDLNRDTMWQAVREVLILAGYRGIRVMVQDGMIKFFNRSRSRSLESIWAVNTTTRSSLGTTKMHWP